MTGGRTVPIVIVNADRSAPWELLAVAGALLLLGTVLRRVPWIRWTLIACGALALISAALLWLTL